MEDNLTEKKLVGAIACRFRQKPTDLYLLSLVLLIAPIMQVFNRPIGQVHILYNSIDDMIPFIPQLIFVYHSWMPLLLVMGFYFWLREPRPLYLRYVFSVTISQLLAFVTFIFFQTEVPRAGVDLTQGGGLALWLIRKTYMVDNHYCGFPSIHVTLCTILIYSLLASEIKKPVKVALVLYTTLIAATTVLVKQHVFWDIPGGLVYGSLGWILTGFILRKYLTK